MNVNEIQRRKMESLKNEYLYEVMYTNVLNTTALNKMLEHEGPGKIDDNVRDFILSYENSDMANLMGDVNVSLSQLMEYKFHDNDNVVKEIESIDGPLGIDIATTFVAVAKQNIPWMKNLEITNNNTTAIVLFEADNSLFEGQNFVKFVAKRIETINKTIDEYKEQIKRFEELIAEHDVELDLISLALNNSDEFKVAMNKMHGGTQ
ncbi:MAG: hypothetical protein RR420_01305 [Anaerovoracaceae bacterium]